MARSSLLAWVVVLVAACSTTVVPPSPPAMGVARPRLTAAATPFDEATLRYEGTARAFVEAFNGARLDVALALVDEHFLNGADCDYGLKTLWSISDRESARNWLQVRIADHDRIEIVRFVDLSGRDNSIGVEIARSSDSIRAAYPDGVVRPRVPMVLRFSLDGQRIASLGFAWTTPVPRFADCVP